MAWQLLIIWTIVMATITWFMRDERRVRAEADIARAARYYAHAAKYRHISSVPEQPAPLRRVGGLNAQQREFMREFSAARTAARPDSP